MPGIDIHDDDAAPIVNLQQPADDEGRNGVADIGAHAVERHDQALAIGEAVASHGIAVGMPDIVADADQRRADKNHPISVRGSHDEIGNADPAQRNRHEQALAADGVDENSAGHIGDGTGRVLAGQDRSDLCVIETEFFPDERQEDIECRRVPMRQRVADADHPDFAKRAPLDRVHWY